MESQESDVSEMSFLNTIMDDPNIETLMESVISSLTDNTIPHPTGELPARTDWPGLHNFEAKVDSSGIHKKHYVYSASLNKLFLDLGKVVPIQIKWDGTPGLFVRGVMLFTQADHMKDPVLRCVIHKDKHDPTNIGYELRDHVLAAENENAKYHVDGISNRHSVVVPLNLQQGCDHTIIHYKFMCKTSCASGINRSPTDVVFTLENETGTVLGRQIIAVKICSCPKRDKEREESLNGGETSGKKKNKIKKEEKSQSLEPPTKKIKHEFNDFHYNPFATFTVKALSPEVAAAAKEHLRKWSDVMAVQWAQPGSTIMPLLDILDDVAILPPPYI